ncbi:uncharacterized protein FFB14_15649 [Fusarium fujikuroi]|nr:uncharacterized protein FFB14_15649 [Fusarium fujikuroi]
MCLDIRLKTLAHNLYDLNYGGNDIELFTSIF